MRRLEFVRGTCMINVERGSILIGHGLLIDKDFTFERFKESYLYDGQDGIRKIDLKQEQMIDGKKYMISLFFKNGVLYMVSMINCDYDIPVEQETLRKKVHDTILQDIGVKSGCVYNWGKIVSEYDSRSNISSINIYYS